MRGHPPFVSHLTTNIQEYLVSVGKGLDVFPGVSELIGIHIYFQICPMTVYPDDFIACLGHVKAVAAETHDPLLSSLVSTSLSAQPVFPITTESSGEYVLRFLESAVGIRFEVADHRDTIRTQFRGVHLFQGNVKDCIDETMWTSIKNYAYALEGCLGPLTSEVWGMAKDQTFSYLLLSFFDVADPDDIDTTIDELYSLKRRLPSKIGTFSAAIVSERPYMSAFEQRYVQMRSTKSAIMAVVGEMIAGKPTALPFPKKLQMDSGTFFSPYACVLQSSGAGKSRLVHGPPIESDKSRLFFIVMTCGKMSGGALIPSGGYPPASIMYKDFVAAMQLAENATGFGHALQQFVLAVIERICKREGGRLLLDRSTGGESIDEIFKEGEYNTLGAFSQNRDISGYTMAVNKYL